jgi:creatinine amidohydrolase/Fe(II)-dependent formamide hydrolase-like protein
VHGVRRRTWVGAAWAGATGWATLLQPAPARAEPAPPLVELERMTTDEVRERVAAGSTTILLPIGGTEQNGPHMVLGKHNVRARVLAVQIAQRLGNALVAPVLAYVPEGAIDPPAAHMRFAGTISVPEPAFEAVLDAAARSFRRHGLRDVCLLGDHGGYQQSLQRVAARFERSATGPARCRVHAVPEYYRAAQQGFADLLAARGFGASEIGLHAGLSDTSLALAVDPTLVRADRLARVPAAGDGVQGDPRRATAELGRLGVAHVVAATAAAIERRVQAR